jgi:hypothetical protein
MIFHVLIKRYSDNSGFYVVGATDEDAIAQAFCAGGKDGAATAESYMVDTEASILAIPDGIKPTDWE